MSEATTTEAAATPAAPTAPTVSQDVINAAVAQALAADREARKARKAAKATAPAETAPAAEAAVTETTDERINRLVEEKLAAINAPSPSELAEAEEKRVEQLVAERLVEEKQRLATQGAGPSRKGLVTEHTASQAAAGEVPADLPFKDGKVVPMEQWDESQYRAVGRMWQDHVLGDRAVY